jgi:DNA topoisomerase-6 subunit B
VLFGSYVIAVSVVSPFIKFKNASKETIDASDELLCEIRLALIQAGQKLSKHIKKEVKQADLENKISAQPAPNKVVLKSVTKGADAGTTLDEDFEQYIVKQANGDISVSASLIKHAMSQGK